MKVKIWDGNEFDADDRSEAIEFIKNFLAHWMESTDHIAWYYRGPHGIENVGPPNYAVVVSTDGEHTDASAVIID